MATTYLEYLKAERLNLIKRLNEIDSGLKPTKSEDGDSVDYNGYRSSLVDSLEKINKLILAAEPYQTVSYGRS